MNTLADCFAEQTRRAVAGASLPAFVERLRADAAARHERYGGELHLLEPDVRSGRGGLRDVDVALWAARAHARGGAPVLADLPALGLLSDREWAQVAAADDFLWRVRNELHLHVGRKHDQMSFDLQEHVAEAFGYEAEGDEGLPVESLMRDYYLGRAEVYGVTREARPLFTDKMPLNDTHLPLIRLAFPHAPILRMVRHPLDVAVSMLSHNLTHGHNSGYAIDSIIRHMVTMHDMTAHYDEVLDHPVLTVHYEAFIADQEAVTRQVLDWCGLSFDEATLRFHENRRHAPTPSYAQVSKPLNDRSVSRWRHYERQLSPWFGQIAPVVEALGYSLYANEA